MDQPRAFLGGLLESAAAYAVTAAAALTLHRAGVRLPGALGDQYLAVVALAGVSACLLLGRWHQQRGRERRGAGVYAGAGIWPLVVLAVVLSRFAFMVIGWGVHGE